MFALSSHASLFFLLVLQGTGKTFLLKYVIQELLKKHDAVSNVTNVSGTSAVAVVAPTGMAAIVVGGQTG